MVVVMEVVVLLWPWLAIGCPTTRYLDVVSNTSRPKTVVLHVDYIITTPSITCRACNDLVVDEMSSYEIHRYSHPTHCNA